MLTSAIIRPHASRHCFQYLLQCSAIHSVSSNKVIESIQTAVEAKSYGQIPDLLNESKESCLNPNAFSFLNTFSPNHRTQIIDEILQSFISLRPRNCPQAAYSCLLFYTLQSPNPFPLALAILQRTLRSGCVPVPQTHLLLSTAWLEHRQQSESVSSILMAMQSIGYSPDCGTCNYIILSLCKVDQLKEAVKVLKGMSGARCIPDSDSFGNVISKMCELRKINDISKTMEEMVGKFGLIPREDILVKVAAAFRAKKEVWRAVEMIEFFEEEGFNVGFDIYELVVQGCLEYGQFVLAGKVVMKMTERSFIPHIGVRQQVIEGLANVGEWGLAYAVRQRFAKLKS